MFAELQPIALIIATGNRAAILRRTLESLAGQSTQPETVIIVDASENRETREAAEKPVQALKSKIAWQPAAHRGAAAQRNQGVLGVDAVFVGFCDDDIIFETDCIKRMWEALRGGGKLGGVNATITNQGYHSPGRATRLVLRMMHSRHEPTYAGRVIGPAVNLLPEDRSDLPEVVPVDWLNTTCTMYRREALPVPPFDSCFSGYSMLEDLALSLRVSRRWRLANVRTARIYHDSQPGPQKSDPRIVAEMELRNRHYIMREILGRNRIADHARLALWETFQLAALVARPSGLGELPKVMAGKIAALRHIFSNNGAF